MSEPPRKRPRVSPPPATPAPPPPAPAAAAQGPYAGSQPGAGTQPEAPPHAPFASHAVHPPASYLSSPSVPPTAFQQPSHLASFSYSPARDLLLDDAHRDDALAFYREPRIGSDLNWGFERAVWRDGSVDEGLDALLDSLSTWAAKQPQPAADDLLGKIAVMTWRGMLTKLMLAVHEVDNLASGRRGDGWEMNAMVVDGCLYLEESNPPSKLAAKTASESRNALPSYYGYSFESYCTAPSDLPSEFPIPNTNVQWCSVVKTNLGGFRTIVGGEVDCVRQGADPQRIKTDDFVELKTNIAIQSQRDEVNFERQKLLKHYVQSFLLGVPTVTVGFRTRQGQLTALQSFNTLEIPRLVRGKPHAWTPAACLASARELLAFLHGSVSTHPSTLRAEADLRARASAGTGAGAGAGEDDPAAWPVFRVVFSPQEGVSVRELTPREVHDEVLGAKRAVHGGRVGFLLARWVRERH
ncbi:RAI1-domain-containing protein [Rhodotorula diobovata]|uniref:Decapping nuclease n=1 Tax=Rhodotorula diobovata TaxID=5288 RepID=A0A5C5G6W1_9BASI|nr:RAI1-domain-containing protein [Rhodotorula diobovata]